MASGIWLFLLLTFACWTFGQSKEDDIRPLQHPMHGLNKLLKRRYHRALPNRNKCDFCGLVSNKIINFLRSDEKGSPFMGEKLKNLCTKLMKTKLEQKRCYIVGELIRDPYALVSDVLSPEICYNVQCPSDSSQRIPRYALRKKNCQFCDYIFSKARRSVKFAIIMFNNIYKELSKECSTTLNLDTMQDCMAGTTAVKEITSYLLKQFENKGLCQIIEVC